MAAQDRTAGALGTPVADGVAVAERRKAVGRGTRPARNGTTTAPPRISADRRGIVPVVNTARGNVDGRATAITVLTPMKWWGQPILRVAFWVTTVTGLGLGTLRRLSFIHYARWAIIDRLPPRAAGDERREHLNYPYLFFESNFNGTWDQYIDAFSEVVPNRMRAIWGSSFGFPGPLPTGPFKAYIRRNEFVANHYYSAYPEATTTMILSALQLETRLRQFVRRSAGMEAEEFAAAYERLLTDVQRHL
jgi:hypothetical protein